MKQYIISVKHNDGAILSIGAYTDVLDNRVFRIYINGSDTGRRYAKIGNASRDIQNVARLWRSNAFTYGNADTIPVKGSPWNVALYKRDYCGYPFPNYSDYH